MKRAVFLDRDGVLNEAMVRSGKPHPPHRMEDFQLLPGVVEACTVLRQAGFYLVVATNQPDVGRGELAREIVERMHTQLCEQLPIDRVEVCYDPGGEQSSEFRKPKPGMLLRAAHALDLNLKSSYMVGDRWRDIDCGHAAGCRTVFIDRGYEEPLREQPDLYATDLLAAATLILSERDMER
ncbi:MAG TPA: HAD-IIIA family hydrolase [Bryobacteraceae bacterium]|jgi:D-glycero-D-manno-heptose 1,7-bisphosphate phosphatase|nr:HAD-IIIA family hydrolase [Bryobacteraceae bacterium]